MLPWLVAAPAAAAAAAVPTGDSTEAAAPEPRPAYRTGIVAGFSLGGGVGWGAGYPNDTNDIGKAYYASSGAMAGTSGELLVMGALADYLNFGIWFASASFRDSSQRASQVGLGLRIEGFPLLRLYPRLAGLGVMAQFGLGIARLTTPGQPDAGGTQSYAGTGVFYEWAFGHFLGGHFGAGPSLEYDAVFSRPFDQNGVVATARVVFYGGP